LFSPSLFSQVSGFKFPKRNGCSSSPVSPAFHARRFHHSPPGLHHQVNISTFKFHVDPISPFLSSEIGPHVNGRCSVRVAFARRSPCFSFAGNEDPGRWNEGMCLVSDWMFRSRVFPGTNQRFPRSNYPPLFFLRPTVNLPRSSVAAVLGPIFPPRRCWIRCPGGY